MMKDHGHLVLHFTVYNNQITQLSRLALARSTIWNSEIYRKLRKVIQHEKPDIMHVHNTLPLVSPAAYYAAKAERVAVVQTLHNYRLLCPNATFFRDGRACEDCIRKLVPWPGFYYACYRKNRMATTVIMSMLSLHRLINTWGKYVDVFIALSSFARQKFIDGGLPGEKIVVKPNFVHPDPGLKDNNGNYALFIGRLSAEKGLQTLINAWRKLHDIPIKIIGDGLLIGEIRSLVEKEGLKWIEVLGQVSRKRIFSLMKRARFLVFPSECYETFGLVVAEAFACGVPVIVSRLGAMAEIVEDGRTGLYFEPGNPKDLTTKVEWAWIHEKEMEVMGREARKEYEGKYTAEINYKMLMNIYETAIKRARGKTGNSNIDK